MANLTADAYVRASQWRSQMLRTVLCDDGKVRPNRKACKREGMLLTKRQKRLARRAAGECPRRKSRAERITLAAMLPRLMHDFYTGLRQTARAFYAFDAATNSATKAFEDTKGSLMRLPIA
jgi:hypothetical protein